MMLSKPGNREIEGYRSFKGPWPVPSMLETTRKQYGEVVRKKGWQTES